ncbi:questin oxidase family protein [Candidatus Neomarinimicrobiota bacterium]
MGRSNLVAPWTQKYTNHLESMPASTHPITRDNWQAALGHHDRICDWAKFFERELEHVGWNRILHDWLSRLLPGMSGAAGHAALRTASVVRNLIIEETAARITELGIAMGYWAGSFRKLPGILGSNTSGTYTPLEALFHIKWQHKEQLPHFPSIDHSLSGLERFSPFAGVINLIKIPEASLVIISQITAAMSRVFLTNCQNQKKIAPFILAVVLPSALRSFTSHLEPAQANALLRYGWQFAGAMYAIYGRVNPVEEWAPSEDAQEELIDDAVASRNEYAVIFADACLREYAVQPDTIYLAAAREAISQLSDSTDQRESIEDQ